jgi:hypothetical protein
MRLQMSVPAALLILVISAGVGLAQQKGAPETFTANLQAAGGTSAGGAAAATIQINVQRYTPEADRTAVAGALKSGGYAAFLTALRKAPEVGTVTFGEKKWPIRWAREQTTPKGRNIVVVTDQPIYFVGGGSVDAKPRAGYDVAVIQMFVDDVGLGNGTMAAAAKVKAGGEAGVEIEDYADKPIKMVSVVRKF